VITQVRGQAQRVIMGCMEDPVADAQALIAERFPAARAAFLGGGILSARRTSTSDLDIVVVIDGPPGWTVLAAGCGPDTASRASSEGPLGLGSRFGRIDELP
jgi:hypothetical protein